MLLLNHLSAIEDRSFRSRSDKYPNEFAKHTVRHPGPIRVFILLLLALLIPVYSHAKSDPLHGNDDYDEEYMDDYDDDLSDPDDPLYFWNIAMFNFNDRLYFWALKPAAQGYNKILPSNIRISVDNFFTNLSMPIRFVNCMLQGKFEASLQEIEIFTINSTIGIAGFRNSAKSKFNLPYQIEDLGQTLAVYGVPSGWYIVLPLMGPSTVRDGLSKFGDSLVTPANYLPTFWPYVIRGFQRFNQTSLSLGKYERLKKAAIVPYDSIRDIYLQHRIDKIND